MINSLCFLSKTIVIIVIIVVIVIITSIVIIVIELISDNGEYPPSLLQVAQPIPKLKDPISSPEPTVGSMDTIALQYNSATSTSLASTNDIWSHRHARLLTLAVSPLLLLRLLSSFVSRNVTVRSRLHTSKSDESRPDAQPSEDSLIVSK